jgi:hypothetical protein
MILWIRNRPVINFFIWECLLTKFKLKKRNINLIRKCLLSKIIDPSLNLDRRSKLIRCYCKFIKVKMRGQLSLRIKWKLEWMEVSSDHIARRLNGKNEE